MEDKEIKKLFASYNPPMTDGRDFVGRVLPLLEAVESVRRQNEALRHGTKKACAAGMAIGIIMGALATLASRYVEMSFDMDAALWPLPGGVEWWQFLRWSVVAAVSVLTGWNAYTLTRSMALRIK